MTMFFKASTANLFWKCLSVHGRGVGASTGASIPPSGSVVAKNNNPCTPPGFSVSSMILTRNFWSNEPTSATAATPKEPVVGSSVSSSTDGPPKRGANIFALFIKDHFKTLPADMPLKEKFVRSAADWHQLPESEKEAYKKQMTDQMVDYRQKMSAYLESLGPDGLTEFKKLRKEKVKEKSRARIKTKLRKLNYPKRPCSSYIFFIRDELAKKYPDGKYPPVKTPDHVRTVGIWAQRWHAMNADERKPYQDQAEKDRARYFDALEQWKHNLAKPENEEDLLILERLSRKIENANKSEEVVKKRQRKVAGKIIRRRLDKKVKMEAATDKKKKTVKASKVAKPKKVKKETTSTTTKKATTSTGAKKAKKSSSEVIEGEVLTDDKK